MKPGRRAETARLLLRTRSLTNRAAKGKLASGPKPICTRMRVFVAHSLAAESLRKSLTRYDELVSGRTMYAYVGATPLQSVDPLGLLQWSNTASYGFDMVTSMAIIPYPGAAFTRTREQAGAVTVAAWDLTSRCHCSGSGFVFDEFVVNFEANVHIRSTLPSDITAWARRAEGDHVRDLFGWGSGQAKQVATELENSLKGQSFSSEADCQFSTTQQLNGALMDGGIKEAYDASRSLWDSSGKHLWGGPNQRP
jgi:hypothetical protein